MTMNIPTPTCPAAGPHSNDGKLYTVEYNIRAVHEHEYACASCIATMPGARRGNKLDLSGIATSNVNGSNPTGAF